MQRVGLPLLAAMLCVGILAGLASPVGALPGRTYVTAQRFEHGQMIWRADTSEIWVLFNDGRARLFAPSSYQRLPENPYLFPPAGYVRPMLGFGKVWGHYADVRLGLGWATHPEIGYAAEVRTETGALYLRQLDGLWIAITGGSAWIYRDSPPPQGPAVIWFTASPVPARPGQTVTLSWQVAGADLAQIGLFDTASGSQEPFSRLDNLPLTGSAPITMPSNMPGGVTAIVWAANRVSGAPQDTVQLAQMGLIIDVDTSQAGALTPRATYQPYEHGFMIWREDTSAILAFWGDANGGQWTSIPATQYSSFRDNPIGAVPAPYVRPIMGFGKVWGNLQYVRDVLGYATGPEEGYVTRFELQNGAPASVLLPDGRVVHLNGNTWTF